MDVFCTSYIIKMDVYFALTREGIRMCFVLTTELEGCVSCTHKGRNMDVYFTLTKE